jgi:nucleoside triphosphate pyrophosphatase
VLESPDMLSPYSQRRQVVLASNSPRRRELLSLTGIEFTLLPVQIDETPLPDEDGLEYVKRIAYNKAVASSAQGGVNGVIIAADTAVVNGFGREKAEILGKPPDRKAALEMLLSLRGHTHQVFTAVSILPGRGGTMLSDLCTTDVPMRNYSEGEIEAYVASDDPMDKAGAYAIQHAGFHPVDHLQGCYANVMGLPLCHLIRNLRRLGIHPPLDVPQACQAALKYDCPVYTQILNKNTDKLISI